MVSHGSNRGVNYDMRWETDGTFNLMISTILNRITDGLSNTVFLSETVRSRGPDRTFPAGTLPPAPYALTLNGSAGVNSGLNSVQGMNPTGSPWSSFANVSGRSQMPT